MAVTNRVARCAHCVLNGQFRRMRILKNGRQICESCGHIVFPDDYAFWPVPSVCQDTSLTHVSCGKPSPLIREGPVPTCL
jgi:hypothetical protein